jgi:hypothetical protein
LNKLIIIFLLSLLGMLALFSKLNIATASSPSTPTLILSNTVMDFGQSTLFTANVIGGTSPYNYDYVVFNSSSGNVVANMYFRGISATTNSWFWTPNSLQISNTLKANVVVQSYYWEQPCASGCTWVNISLNNLQAANYLYGTQYMLVVNTLNYTTNINPNANNINFWDGVTGTVLPSYLQGNVLVGGNVLQNTTMNTISNEVFWIKPDISISAATNSVNAITMVFWSNSNNVFSPNTGEAPYLSGPYAQYDDGANVFVYYQRWGNLGPNQFPSGWTSNLSSSPYNAIYTYTTTNTLFNSVLTSLSFNTPGNVVDSMVNILGGAGLKIYGLSTSSGSIADYDIGLERGCGANMCYVTSYGDITSQTSASNVLTPNSIFASTSPFISSVAYTTPTSANVYIDGVLETAIGSGSENPLVVGNVVKNSTANAIFGGYTYESTSVTSMALYTTDTRIDPPNDVFPTETFGTMQLPSTPTIMAANSVFNALQVNPQPTLNITILPQSAKDGANVLFTLSTIGGSNSIYNIAFQNITGNTLIENVILSKGGSTSYYLTALAKSYPSTFTYNLYSTDLGTTTPFQFNGVATSMTVLAPSNSTTGTGGGSGTGGGYCHPYPNCTYSGTGSSSIISTTIIQNGTTPTTSVSATTSTVSITALSTILSTTPTIAATSTIQGSSVSNPVSSYATYIYIAIAAVIVLAIIIYLLSAKKKK